MNKSKIVSLALAGGIILSTNSFAHAATGSDIINTGKQYLGKPYLYGAAIGDLNEFDCSSFTATVFKKYGIFLPRTSISQSQVGTPVNKSDLQAGDLVFFDTDFDGVINHVGIYMGQGQMINATLSGVEIVNMNSSYWAPRYVTARRVLNDETSISTTSANPTSQGTSPSPNSNASSTAAPSSSYTVVSGDSLWSISIHFGLSIAELKSINHLTSDVIYPGQVLNVSKSGSTQTAKTSSSSTASKSQTDSEPTTTKTSTGSSYTVESGDSLWVIAQRFGLTVNQLKTLNNLKSDVIYPGQTLVTAQKSAVSSTQPQSLVSHTKTAPNATPMSDTNKYYTVKKGDTLSVIAFRSGMTLSTLMKLNSLTTTLIFPGDKLLVNHATSTPLAASDSQSKSITKSGSILTASASLKSVKKPSSFFYTVKKGDTLWDIALLNNTNTKNIMKANSLSSAFIFPGQTLLIT